MGQMYKDIAHFRTQKEAARARVERSEMALTNRWNILKASNTRGILMRDAFGDILHSWKPYRVIHDLLRGKVNGSVAEMATSLYASTRPTLLKRMAARAVGFLLSKVVSPAKKEMEVD